MSPRTDLLAMDAEVLMTLTTRGLVNRARRDVETGAVQLESTTDLIRATFASGPVVELGHDDAPADASCSCGSATICRHRVALVLAYRELFPAGHTPVEPDWSPGEFDDVQLKEHVGPAAFAHARRVRAAGYPATVHRSTPSETTVRVDLPQSTVRFLVPHHLAHAHPSATGRAGDVAVVLAVWAAREADTQGVDTVHVGEVATTVVVGESDSAHHIVATILREGVAHLTPTLLASVHRTATTVSAGRATWLSAATTDLVDQLDAYRTRHSRYSRRRMSELLVEIRARASLSRSEQPLIAHNASGLGIVGETSLGRVTLTALGARVSRVRDTTTVEVFFFDRQSLTVSVWRREWDGDRPDHLGDERVLRTTVHSLATSNVVTESAVRSASNRIRFATKGIGRTSVLPLHASDWMALGSRAYKQDYSVVRADLSNRMPSFARERVDTGTMFVFEVAEVSILDYLPGAQILRARIQDISGNRAVVESEYRSESSGALSAIAESLPASTALAGHVRLRDGELVIEPIAIAAGHKVVVPALAHPTAPGALLRAPTIPPGQVVETIDAAATVVADLAHQGLRRPRPAAARLTQQAADRLSGIGMSTTADSMARLAGTLTAPDVEERHDAWLNAAMRLTTASELV